MIVRENATWFREHFVVTERIVRAQQTRDWRDAHNSANSICTGCYIFVFYIRRIVM